MKAISLTEKQKDKLSEICASLFPEYSIIKFSDTDDPDSGANSIEGIVHLGKSIHDGRGFMIELSIHWFELCQFNLPKKLFYAYYEEYQDGCMYLDFMDKYLTYTLYSDFNNHPVDYLYNKFIELSNAKR